MFADIKHEDFKKKLKTTELSKINCFFFLSLSKRRICSKYCSSSRAECLAQYLLPKILPPPPPPPPPGSQDQGGKLFPKRKRWDSPGWHAAESSSSVVLLSAGKKASVLRVSVLDRRKKWERARDREKRKKKNGLILLIGCLATKT